MNDFIFQNTFRVDNLVSEENVLALKKPNELNIINENELLKNRQSQISTISNQNLSNEKFKLLARTRTLSRKLIAKDIIVKNLQTEEANIIDEDKNQEKYLNSLKKIQSSDKFISKFFEILRKKEFLNIIPIIHPSNIFIQYWNIYLCVLLIYSILIMPFIICFINGKEKNELVILDIIIDFSYILDILVNLNSGYHDKDKIIVLDRKKIFFNYFKRRLILDTISSLPLTLIFKFSSRIKFVEKSVDPHFNSIRLIKLIRIFRYKSIFHKSKLFSNTTINFATYQFLTFLLFTILISHIAGCLWFLLPQLYSPSDNWIYNLNLEDCTIFRLYLISIYWAFSTVFTVGFGDIYAFNKIEYFISIVWMIFGVGFFSFSIGTLSSILVNLNSSKNLLKKKLEILDNFSRETQLPEEMKKKIKNILVYNSHKNIYSFDQQQEIFHDLPSGLKCEIACSMRNGFLKNHSFFLKKDDTFISIIVPFLHPLNFNAKEKIYLKNDHPNSVFFIQKGSVYFLNDEMIPFKKIVVDSYFGEIEIIEKSNRYFSVVANELSQTLTLSKQIYENILVKEFVEVHNEIKELSEIRKSNFLKTLEDSKKNFRNTNSNVNRKTKVEVNEKMKIENTTDTKEDSKKIQTNNHRKTKHSILKSTRARFSSHLNKLFPSENEKNLINPVKNKNPDIKKIIMERTEDNSDVSRTDNYTELENKINQIEIDQELMIKELNNLSIILEKNQNTK